MSIARNTDGTRRRRRRGLLSAAVAVMALCAGMQVARAGPKSGPAVPADLAVPAGHVLTDVGRAQGFQIYGCEPLAIGYGWMLQQPQAVLLEEGHRPMALHYGGPTWTAMDGSTVVATKVASAPPTSESAIPWLLLRATSASGPYGGTFTSTAYIQRINTTGGVAPAGGCDADHVGTSARVFYTADYYFYAAA